MTRLLSSVALAAAIAASSSAVAQMATTTQATINDVKVSGALATPVNGPATSATDSAQNIKAKLRDARPSMPTLVVPPASDSKG